MIVPYKSKIYQAHSRTANADYTSRDYLKSHIPAAATAHNFTHICLRSEMPSSVVVLSIINYLYCLFSVNTGQRYWCIGMLVW